ncbi:NAD-dependent protein deacylase [Priestia megaterium]|nr:NAD-dependent protein deacylase [Priestia megaterium]
METKIKQLQQLIKKADKICFFTGAGISTESGIPDFRSQNGLYKQNISFADVISKRFYDRSPEKFWPLFKEIFYLKMLHQYAPNRGHQLIANLEKSKVIHVITQNIDGLHQEAGSTNVYEIHGTIKKAHCPSCGSQFDLAYMNKTALPACEACTHLLKPNVVLFGDEIHQFEQAAEAALQSDLFVVMGSSLEVTPINQIPLLVSKHTQIPMVMINKEVTQYDDVFDLVIHDSIGGVVSRL